MKHRKPAQRWQVWLNAYSHLGGDQLLATHRWKWVANLHAGQALQSFQGYVYSVTVKPIERDAYGVEHVLTITELDNGVEYSCSCGFSRGWIEGTREDAERINAVAHQNWWERERPA